MRRRNMILVLLPILTVASAGCGGGPEDGFLIASGTVEATDADLGFQLPGRVAVIEPREGDSVSVGQELAWLDRAEWQAALASAAAQLAAAEARLSELESGARPQELTQAEAVLRAANQRTEDPWGVRISLVEVKDALLPESMQRVMARQAEAEREKRAKIIHAHGEFEAAETLKKAAEVIASEPITLQLRYLQTLVEISGEKNATIIPFPLDILNNAVAQLMSKAEDSPAGSGEPPTSGQ